MSTHIVLGLSSFSHEVAQTIASALKLHGIEVTSAVEVTPQKTEEEALLMAAADFLSDDSGLITQETYDSLVEAANNGNDFPEDVYPWEAFEDYEPNHIIELIEDAMRSYVGACYPIHESNINLAMFDVVDELVDSGCFVVDIYKNNHESTGSEPAGSTYAHYVELES